MINLLRSFLTKPRKKIHTYIGIFVLILLVGAGVYVSAESLFSDKYLVVREYKRQILQPSKKRSEISYYLGDMELRDRALSGSLAQNPEQVLSFSIKDFVSKYGAPAGVIEIEISTQAPPVGSSVSAELSRIVYKYNLDGQLPNPVISDAGLMELGAVGTPLAAKDSTQCGVYGKSDKDRVYCTAKIYKVYYDVKNQLVIISLFGPTGPTNHTFGPLPDLTFFNTVYAGQGGTQRLWYDPDLSSMDIVMKIETKQYTSGSPGVVGGPNETTSNYNISYQGVSVHVAGETLNADGSVSAGIANVTRGGRARYTMTVNNPDLAAKAVDLRFDIPVGFGLVALPAGATQSGQRLTWSNYPLPAGQASVQITIDVQAP